METYVAEIFVSEILANYLDQVSSFPFENEGQPSQSCARAGKIVIDFSSLSNEKEENRVERLESWIGSNVDSSIVLFQTFPSLVTFRPSTLPFLPFFPLLDDRRSSPSFSKSWIELATFESRVSRDWVSKGGTLTTIDKNGVLFDRARDFSISKPVERLDWRDFWLAAKEGKGKNGGWAIGGGIGQIGEGKNAGGTVLRCPTLGSNSVPNGISVSRRASKLSLRFSFINFNPDFFLSFFIDPPPFFTPFS